MCEAYFLEVLEHCGHIRSPVPKPTHRPSSASPTIPQWTVEQRQAQSKRIKESLALIGLQRLRLRFRQWKSRDWPFSTGITQLSGSKTDNTASFRKRKMKRATFRCNA